MARPRTFSEPVAFRGILAPAWLWSKVRERAKLEGTSMSELVCRAVTLYLLGKGTAVRRT